MSFQNFDLVARAVISAVFILAGLKGTSFCLRNTVGPRERQVALVSSAGSWLLIMFGMAGFWLLPPTLRHWSVLLLAILLPMAMTAGLRRQVAIRREEQESSGSATPA